jgi:hypothetical protein
MEPNPSFAGMPAYRGRPAGQDFGSLQFFQKKLISHLINFNFDNYSKLDLFFANSHPHVGGGMSGGGLCPVGKDILAEDGLGMDWTLNFIRIEFIQ